MNIALALHGGAGTILRSAMSAEKETAYRTGLHNALSVGWRLLQDGAGAVDVVTEVVRQLEDDPLFNAGRGSVFTNDGQHEMDASVMDGRTLEAGSVAAVRNVRNPILLARRVMDHSEHVLLAGAGAEAFARMENIRFEDDEYFFDEYRHNQLLAARAGNQTLLDHSDDRKFGTVGAVAVDAAGNLGAATSTGGMTNKRFGRVGDSPIIGIGTYANNRTCAVSCTGHGEYFIRSVVAYDVSCLMEYRGLSLHEACELVVNDKLRNIGGEGGLIAVDAAGNIAMPFNSDGMYRASVSSREEMSVEIWTHP